MWLLWKRHKYHKGGLGELNKALLEITLLTRAMDFVLKAFWLSKCISFKASNKIAIHQEDYHLEGKGFQSLIFFPPSGTELFQWSDKNTLNILRLATGPPSWWILSRIASYGVWDPFTAENSNSFGPGPSKGSYLLILIKCTGLNNVFIPVNCGN